MEVAQSECANCVKDDCICPGKTIGFEECNCVVDCACATCHDYGTVGENDTI